MWLVKKQHLLQERERRVLAESKVKELTARNAALRTALSRCRDDVLGLQRRLAEQGRDKHEG